MRGSVGWRGRGLGLFVAVCNEREFDVQSQHSSTVVKIRNSVQNFKGSLLEVFLK